MTLIRLCPRCFLQMNAEDVMNALSHDGKMYVCNYCGQIESLQKLNPDAAYGLVLGQHRSQAAMWGLNKDRRPNLPKIQPQTTRQIWYDTETKFLKLIDKVEK